MFFYILSRCVLPMGGSIIPSLGKIRMQFMVKKGPKIWIFMILAIFYTFIGNLARRLKV